MKERVIWLCNHLISISFYALLFVVPLLLTPFNYELFEYNKMMGVYAITIVIAASWVSKMILTKKFEIRRSPFDLFIVLFFISQFLSTIFSIDRHVSIFGYYSRFNGGLLSVISYITLYYAFLTNVAQDKIRKYLFTALGSAIVVSSYGVLEHFGIDKHIWIQDVQNRIFSTLGQPNWLAAYIAVLTPIAIAFGMEKYLQANMRKSIYIFSALTALFYLTLSYTRSRSGFFGFWAADAAFWLLLFARYKKTILKAFLFMHVFFLVVSLYYGTPFYQLDQFRFSRIFEKKAAVESVPAPKSTETVLETGVTESGNIRKIVWKGATDIMKAYPLFGSGLETFAYSYYKYRPVEHNMTSEWDFLYNKAHNEYLNYGATSGIFGLGSYMLFIGAFIVWNIRTQISGIRNKKDAKQTSDTKYLILNTGLFVGWLSILITNFLGFSVVIIQIFFFLIPAISYMLNNADVKIFSFVLPWQKAKELSRKEWLSMAVIVVAGGFGLYTLSTMWLADVAYARGYQASRAGSYLDAYKYMQSAIMLNPNEVLYFDELSLPAAEVGLAAAGQKQSTVSAQLLNESVAASNIAVRTSPNNVNFFKTRTRVFYALAQIDQKYLSEAINSLEKARQLSPTDPKIAYNLGLLYGRTGKANEAIEMLKKASALKPDYKDSHFALALFYKEQGEKSKAKEELNFILTKISPQDEEAKKMLSELK